MDPLCNVVGHMKERPLKVLKTKILFVSLRGV